IQVYVPGAPGVHDVETLALPPTMFPLPLALGTAGTVHAVSLYSVKLTVPLGFRPPLIVAVSVTVSGWPTVPVVGLAVVLIVGLALLTVEDSLASLQTVSAAELRASPL